MEHGVPRSGEHGGGEQGGVAVGRAQRERGERQESDPGREDALRCVPIHRETGQRLTHAGDDEEPGGERTGASEAEAELRHQPGKERGDDQVEEVRGGVREADQRHDARVPCARETGSRIHARPF